MKSARRGMPTSEVEVTNVSCHGFWLLIRDHEVFLPFEQFPWFKDAPLGRILSVQLPHPHHLYWPDLDVDIAVESIDHPERYPLVSRHPRDEAPAKRVRQGRPSRSRRGSTRDRAGGRPSKN